MRTINQKGASYVALKARNTEDRDSLTVIMISDMQRGPEAQAFPDSDDRADKLPQVVVEEKHDKTDHYCSEGHYSKPSAFNVITDKATGKQRLDNYCKDCRLKQQKRWEMSAIFDKINRMLNSRPTNP